jgi:hypothetical protein
MGIRIRMFKRRERVSIDLIIHYVLIETAKDRICFQLYFLAVEYSISEETKQKE